jgi:pantoate--beta-alanine ligase
MKVFQSSGQIHGEINFLRSQGKKVGLVPTMGALHQGHIALIQRALMACDTVVCSIFVNPLQFNNPEDFNKYPNTIARDTQMLEEIDCHLLFNPNYEQIYGQSEPKEYDLGHLNDVMEGPFRPGHFQGVANVVMRFFEIIQPDMAFFGLKDYQQYMVVKRITAQLMPHIQIMGVETVRDEKGLAMSSRNMRLTPEEYQSAVQVPELLKKVSGKLKDKSVEEVKDWFTKSVNKIPHLKNEYIELADAETLDLVTDPSNHQHIRVFTAFYAGEVRLIDNMPFI